MEGREEHCPLYPNDKTIPFPLGSALSLRGRGLSFLGLALGLRIGVVLRAIGDVCGGRDVNIVVPLYTKL